MSYNPYSDSYIIKYPNGDVTLERRSPDTSNSNPTIHTVMEGETLQDISFKYYGDSGYWMIIAEANELFFPLRELTPNTQIVIP